MRFSGSVVIAVLLPHILGCPLWIREAVLTCWSGEYTADRCCKGPDPGDPSCWDDNLAKDGLTYQNCCEQGAKSTALEVWARWETLVGIEGLSSPHCSSPSSSLHRSQEGLSCCLGDGVTAGAPWEVLKVFSFRSKRRFSWHAAEVNDLDERRLRLRRGQLERPGRCSPNKLEGDHSDADIGSRLLSPLRLLQHIGGLRGGQGSGGGWTVNLGGGCYQYMRGVDPVDALVGVANMSAIYVDPMGPCGGGDETRQGVRFVKAAATPQNLCELLGAAGLRCGRRSGTKVPIQMLKIDIDSSDCSLAAAALKLFRPKAIWLEVNLDIPPPFRFARHWHDGFFQAWERWSFFGRTFATFGCSSSSAVELMSSEGYGLFGFDGSDAVFVDYRFSDLVGGVGIDEFLCYHEVEGPIRVPEAFVHEWALLPPSVAFSRLSCNLSLHDYLLGIQYLPATLEF